MSFYNLLCGFSPACYFVLPMLGHREDYYPRFRDAFMFKTADGVRELGIFTRVGSANQNCGFGEEKLMGEPGFLRFEDCEDDRTYGTYVFQCPEKWEDDFDKIAAGRGAEVSEEFQNLLRDFWPKIGGRLVELLRGENGKCKE